MKRIIYYYQTFTDLSPILIQNTPVTHIHLSSIHFGLDNDNKPYIHLNDYSPFDSKFDKVWKDMKTASELGIKIVLMIGGAGGAYQTLFSNYNIYYTLLKELLNSKTMISGVDLDIEEFVDIEDVKKLMKNIKTDFPSFSISMAPIQSSLEEDLTGMGGFCYKDLWKSPEGALIDYFNGQFYSSYTKESLQTCINNHYPGNMIVMGMCGCSDFDNKCRQITDIISDNIDFGGVFLWEYCLREENWDKIMSLIINYQKYGCSYL